MYEGTISSVNSVSAKLIVEAAQQLANWIISAWCPISYIYSYGSGMGMAFSVIEGSQAASKCHVLYHAIIKTNGMPS